MDWTASLTLGLIQGITAWIPVSSKTQVLLAGTWLYQLPFATLLAYALVLHLGDLIAALHRYRKEYTHALLTFLKGPQAWLTPARDEQTRESQFLVTAMLATSALALPLYLLAKKAYTALTGEPLLAAVGLGLLAMGALEHTARRKRPATESKLTLEKALLTGAAQACSVIPGISRSGSTQAALLLQGFAPEQSVRLSFLLSAPMITAALLAFYLLEGGYPFPLQSVIIGVTASAIASWLTMDLLTKIARKIPNHLFLYAVGLLALTPLLIKTLLGIGD